MVSKKVLPLCSIKLFDIMRLVIILAISLGVLACKNTSETKTNQLEWLTIEEANDILKEGTNKKFVVDVYTDWCHWCKVMDKKTFSDPEVISYLNENFHMVKFNAEQKESVLHKGKEYIWQSMGRNGVNGLGIELLNGRMSYPSLVYLNEKFETILISPGYKEPQQLMGELKSL